MRAPVLCSLLFLACAHRVLSGPIGPRAPTSVMATAPDGRWAVLCQAREDTNHNGRLSVAWSDFDPDLIGDALAPYFISGPGLGFRLENWLGADPTGRWVAFVRNGELTVRDTVSGLERDLSSLGASANFASFSSDGREVIYARGPESRTIVVQDLESGTQKTFEEPTPVSEATLDRTGRWLLVWNDPPPFLAVNRTPNEECSSRVLVHATDDPGPDRVRALESDVSVPLGRKGLLVGPVAVRIRDDGAAVGTDPSGRETIWAPPECGAKVFVSGANDTLALLCQHQGNRLILERDGRPIAPGTELSVDFARTAPVHDGLPRALVTFVISSHFTASNGVPSTTEQLMLFDLRDHTQRPLSTTATLLAEGQRFALFQNGPVLELLDLDSKEARRFGSARGGGEAAAPPWVFIGGYEFNLDTGRVRRVDLGDATVVGMRNDGALLVTGDRPIPYVMINGPLEWIDD